MGLGRAAEKAERLARALGDVVTNARDAATEAEKLDGAIPALTGSMYTPRPQILVDPLGRPIRSEGWNTSGPGNAANQWTNSAPGRGGGLSSSSSGGSGGGGMGSRAHRFGDITGAGTLDRSRDYTQGGTGTVALAGNKSNADPTTHGLLRQVVGQLARLADNTRDDGGAGLRRKGLV